MIENGKHKLYQKLTVPRVRAGHQHMLSCCIKTYPVVVLESAPITTPPSYSTAIIVVCRGSQSKHGEVRRQWHYDWKQRSSINHSSKYEYPFKIRQYTDIMNGESNQFIAVAHEILRTIKCLDRNLLVETTTYPCHVLGRHPVRHSGRADRCHCVLVYVGF